MLQDPLHYIQGHPMKLREGRLKQRRDRLRITLRKHRRKTTTENKKRKHEPQEVEYGTPGS